MVSWLVRPFLRYQVFFFPLLNLLGQAGRCLRPLRVLACSAWIVRIATLLVLALSSVEAHAAITFTLNTGNAASATQKLLIDSNNCAGSGARSAFVGGIVRNTGSSAVTGIEATMSGLTGNISFAGGQQATQYLGTLGAGESVGVYWFVGYTCTEGATATPTIALNSSLGSQSSNVNLHIYTAISANAGGLVNSSTLGPGAVVGQTITLDIEYSFGGASAGDEYYLQPAGNPSFNAACFRLVDARILSSIVTAIPAGSSNTLYYQASAKQTGTSQTVTVRYFLQYRCADVSTSADPYAAQTSGSTNLKYTGNFGSVVVTYPVGTNPFTIAKSVSPSVGVAGSTAPITYTITLSNPSSYPTIIDRIEDVLPAGMTFIAISAESDVDAAVAGSLPAPDADGTLQFAGKLGVSFVLPANASIKLVYTATPPSSEGTYTNTAKAFIGSASTSTSSVPYSVVPAVNPVTESASVTAGSETVAIADVRSNDTINGEPATSANATISADPANPLPTGITLDTDTGAITVAASVAPGAYDVWYRLCDLVGPTCATVRDEITVSGAVADLAVTKSNSTSEVTSGEETTYVILVSNLGPASVDGAIVQDVVGEGLTCPDANLVTLSGDGVPAGTFTLADLTGAGLTLGALAAGQSTSISYSCTVN